MVAAILFQWKFAIDNSFPNNLFPFGVFWNAIFIKTSVAVFRLLIAVIIRGPSIAYEDKFIPERIAARIVNLRFLRIFANRIFRNRGSIHLINFTRESILLVNSTIFTFRIENATHHHPKNFYLLVSQP